MLFFLSLRNHNFYRRHTEAEVAILIVRNYGVGALYKMEMTGRSNGEPGVFAIVKRFRDGVEHDYLLIKTSAHRKVFNIYSDMVQYGFTVCAWPSWVKKVAKIIIGIRRFQHFILQDKCSGRNFWLLIPNFLA